MYVARDKCGDLCLFTGRPVKIDEYWLPTKHCFDWIRLDSELFPEVKWEDEEPTEVELVKKKGYNIWKYWLYLLEKKYHPYWIG